MAPHDPGLLAGLIAIWIMLNGFALVFGMITADPVRNVQRLNRWLLRQVLGAIAGTLRWVANQIAPSKGRRK